jgi:hypothetical protein
MLAKGHVPLRDFWYPYGNFSLFYADVGWGLVWEYFYALNVHVGFFLSTYLLAGRRVLWPLAGWVLLILGENALTGYYELSLYPSIARSLSGIVPALAYVAIDREKPRFQFAHALFGYLCCNAIFFEPSQLINSAIGIALVLGLDLWQSPPRSWTLIAARLAREFALPSAFLVCFLAVIGVQGRWQGFADFYLHFGDVVNYSAQPADLTTIVSSPMGVDYSVIGMPIALVSFGLIRRLDIRNETRVIGANVLIVLGMCGFMILQKHVVRPILASCLLPQAIALLVCGALALAERHRSTYVVLALIAAAYASMVTGGEQRVNPVSHLWKSAGRAAGDADVLLRRGAYAQTIDEVKELRFDDARFENFPRELALATHLRNLRGDGRPPTIYALGQSVLYILMDQKTPYHTNPYNASPIYEQRKVVAWLREVRPEFVIWDPEVLTFDGIPNHLRVPLIYGEVISGFVPHSTVEGYELLRSRRADEPVALGYWKLQLGDTVSLAHLARNSSFDSFEPCPTGDEDQCSDFLVVSFDATPAELSRSLAMTFNIGEELFRVTFDLYPGETTYHVLLDRVWFWNAASQDGISCQLVPENLPQGVSASIVRRRAEPGILY